MLIILYLYTCYYYRVIANANIEKLFVNIRGLFLVIFKDETRKNMKVHFKNTTRNYIIYSVVYAIENCVKVT